MKNRENLSGLTMINDFITSSYWANVITCWIKWLEQINRIKHRIYWLVWIKEEIKKKVESVSQILFNYKHAVKNKVSICWILILIDLHLGLYVNLSFLPIYFYLLKFAYLFLINFFALSGIIAIKYALSVQI